MRERRTAGRVTWFDIGAARLCRGEPHVRQDSPNSADLVNELHEPESNGVKGGMLQTTAYRRESILLSERIEENR